MIPLCILVIQDEDDRAFMTELYITYRRLMLHEIIKIVKDTWAAEDILQSSIENLIDKVKELRKKDRDHLVNYIISTSKNNALYYLRKKKTHPEFVYDEAECQPDHRHDRRAMDEQLILECDINALSEVWPQLDERTRQILVSKYVLEKTDAEMAAELNISPGSVRMALTRARRSAKKMMYSKQE